MVNIAKNDSSALPGMTSAALDRADGVSVCESKPILHLPLPTRVPVTPSLPRGLFTRNIIYKYANI